jgi:hypothetical protein
MPNQQHGQDQFDRRDPAQGDKSRQSQSPDRSMVGQDTDGDGKVVKPGQKPGQSHGTGVINK